MQTELRTLIPAIVFLVIFAGTISGKHFDELTITQLVTALITLIGTILGIFVNHKKPQETAPVTPQPVEIKQPTPPPVP